MTGTVSLPHAWGPWAGGDEVSFERADVVAIGKLRRRNDARQHIMVELVDGRRAFVTASTQPDDDKRWLLSFKKLCAILDIRDPRATHAEAWQPISPRISP